MNQKSTLLVRYGEIGLKGGNRPAFERALCANLKSALGPLPGLITLRRRGRILVEADVDLKAHIARAAQVFGVTSLSPADKLYLDAEAIKKRAAELVQESLQQHFAGREQVTFRITVNRGNKAFPKTSLQLTLELADLVLPANPSLKVQLKGAELTLEVDIREEEALVFARRHAGPAGLPVGSMGRGLTLLSGGIDSPVAAWMMMKRGMRMEFVSFYSFPHTGPQSREKIIRLAEELGQWQPRTVLHMVPFAAYQEAIRDTCPEPYRTVLYRRAMQRIASLVAARRKCRALVTGESLGQVASQTMQNMAVIEEASRIPVLRPLIGMDKTEAITMARNIGTYKLSTLPAPDCCTVFQPESPIIFGRLEDALKAEEALDIETLTFQAVKGAEKLELPEEE
ncbi:MAG: tRNA 4-thiouridine(8) synthase ThiI [Planctomycetes bacterium]|nr:tRNA 4-thiouridine(8) synthase ThiI [Planctomycetota bacterium]MCP4771386.1 tRNA 4-thiouridine(8) synthase ThiI [Planctomycetota bacterium]MCP4861823.1 tRNA 4-thiouridine(8) synthase ThiI [Planctomycetota bacterium]